MPIFRSIFLHCDACCATDETEIGSLSIFQGEATDSLPPSQSSTGSNRMELRTAVRSAANPERFNDDRDDHASLELCRRSGERPPLRPLPRPVMRQCQVR